VLAGADVETVVLVDGFYVGDEFFEV